MSLIIKDKIPMFIVGYPTVSDKYNVAGGMIDQTSDAVEFGDLVEYGSTTGFYKKATNVTTTTQIAGFVLATNVKLNTEWPAAETVKTLPGEAFNLLVNGFIAIALDTTAVVTNVKPNAKVYITAGGKCTTESTGNIELTNATFTGMQEKHGTIIVAEIYVK